MILLYRRGPKRLVRNGERTLKAPASAFSLGLPMGTPSRTRQVKEELHGVPASQATREKIAREAEQYKNKPHPFFKALGLETEKDFV
jgi:hypothetical protein